MLTRDQVAVVVRDHRSYYDAMLRNGWRLPSRKQSVVTLQFMEKGRSGAIFCPRVEHIKSPPICLTPPPKEKLIEKIIEAAGVLGNKG